MCFMLDVTVFGLIFLPIIVNMVQGILFIQNLKIAFIVTHVYRARVQFPIMQNDLFGLIKVTHCLGVYRILNINSVSPCMNLTNHKHFVLILVITLSIKNKIKERSFFLKPSSLILINLITSILKIITKIRTKCHVGKQVHSWGHIIAVKCNSNKILQYCFNHRQLKVE